MILQAAERSWRIATTKTRLLPQSHQLPRLSQRANREFSRYLRACFSTLLNLAASTGNQKNPRANPRRRQTTSPPARRVNRRRRPNRQPGMVKHLRARKTVRPLRSRPGMAPEERPKNPRLLSTMRVLAEMIYLLQSTASLAKETMTMSRPMTMTTMTLR